MGNPPRAQCSGPGAKPKHFGSCQIEPPREPSKAGHVGKGEKTLTDVEAPFAGIRHLQSLFDVCCHYEITISSKTLRRNRLQIVELIADKWTPVYMV